MLGKFLRIGIPSIIYLAIAFSIHAEKYELQYKPPNTQLRINRPLANGYYTGIIQFGKTKHLIAIVDYNNDRNYNQYFMPQKYPFDERLYGSGDQIMIDLNDDETFVDPEELQPYSKHIKVGDKWYSIDISRDGSKVDVQELNLELGKVKFPSNMICESVYLFSEDGVIKLDTSKQECQIPAGTYQLFSYAVRVKDYRQDWYYEAIGTTSGRKYQVTKDNVTNLDFGSPIYINVSYSMQDQRSRTPKTNDKIDLALNLTGIDGERFTWIDSGANKNAPRKVPKNPTFKVIDENGRTVAKGTFEYG